MPGIRQDGSRSFIKGLAVISLLRVGEAYAEQKPLSYGSTSDRNPFTKEFGEFAKQTLEEWHVPGLSIAAIDDDRVFAEVPHHWSRN